MGLQFIRGAASAAALLCLSAAQSAAAHGGIQVDTDVLKSFGSCDLGSASCSPADLGFTITRPDGTTFNQIYIYTQGVIGLGAPILGDKATLLAGGLGALGDSFLAPGFSSFSGLSVEVNAFQMGGSISGYPGDGVRTFLVNWYVDGFPLSPDDVPCEPDDSSCDPYLYGHSGRGAFQVEFDPLHWSGSFPDYELNGDNRTNILFNYTGVPGKQDPSIYYDLTGLTADSKVGYKIGKFSGSRSLAAPEVSLTLPGVPEPATWAMLILGFGAIGGLLRRERKRTVATA